MAKLPRKRARGADPLEEESNRRLTEARRHKLQFELDFREGYFFAAPHRSRVVLSTIEPTRTKPQDAAVLNQSFAFEVCPDFATVVINTFLPEAESWALRRAGPNIPEGARAQINQQVEPLDKRIFEAIGASNFYAACGMGFTPDLGLGTVALWIDQVRLHEPINCQSVPIRELEINTGPHGGIDDRFVVRYTRNHYVKVLLPGVELPKDVAKEITDSPDDRTEVVWGFWRLWDRLDDEYWQATILVGGVLVKSLTLKGAGCCPLVIGRWRPSSEWSWGVGPLIEALPDLRHLDALAGAKIKNLELNLQPPIAFPDDSFSNIEEGLEPGMAYPVRPGSEGAIKNIYQANPPDAAIYDRQSLEQRIKRLFFLDFPEQRADTPPTATQWLDQMTMAQRRIGTPGLVFWQEFCAGSFQRFEYLLEKGGAIEPVRVDGRTIALSPYNPAQRAADQQDIAQFAKFVQLAAGALPEEWKIFTDGKMTIEALAKKMNVGGIWKERSADQIQGAIDQMKQLQAGTPGTAPSIPSEAAPPTAQDVAGVAPAPAQYITRAEPK